VVVNGRPLTFVNLDEAVPRAGTLAAFTAWVAPKLDPSVTRMTSRRSVSTSTAGWWSWWVLDPEDARRSVDAGVDGIVVSNHGGRQLDSVLSTVPDVIDAVGGRTEVLADGRIRTGLDVVKMIALGARAVMIGRAWARAWACALG
jgi:L-lactate dehydrogenase (cytochrome)